MFAFFKNSNCLPNTGRILSLLLYLPGPIALSYYTGSAVPFFGSLLLELGVLPPFCLQSLRCQSADEPSLNHSLNQVVVESSNPDSDQSQGESASLVNTPASKYGA